MQKKDILKLREERSLPTNDLEDALEDTPMEMDQQYASGNRFLVYLPIRSIHTLELIPRFCRQGALFLDIGVEKVKSQHSPPSSTNRTNLSAHINQSLDK
eukprot:scaffold2848_cov150-Skeletonema_menzelii.AAC.32